MKKHSQFSGPSEILKAEDTYAFPTQSSFSPKVGETAGTDPCGIEVFDCSGCHVEKKPRRRKHCLKAS
jgi:hypothetical protein